MTQKSIDPRKLHGANEPALRVIRTELDKVIAVNKTLNDKTVYDAVKVLESRMQKICPHPKDCYSYGGFEYAHESCTLCNLSEFY